MRAQHGNNTSRRKTFLIIGLVVATLVMIQGSNRYTNDGASITQKLSFSTQHVKGKVMFIGRFTKSLMKTFD